MKQSSTLEPAAPHSTRVLPERRETSARPHSAPVGLGRSSLTADDVAAIRPRELNVKFALILGALTALSLFALNARHGRQMRKHVGALLSQARLADQAGDIARAKDYYSRYSWLAPQDSNALAEFGLLMERTRPEGSSARPVFNRFEDVLRIDPTREDIRRQQVRIALEAGRAPDSLAHAKILLQAHPADGELHLLAARGHEELGQYPEAVAEYESAIELAPRLIEAFDRLAWLQRKHLEQPDQADATLQTLIRHNAEHAEAWLVVVQHAQHKHDDAAAREALQRAMDLTPSSPQVLQALAALSYSQAAAARDAGRPVRERRIVQQALQQLNQHRDVIAASPLLQRQTLLLKAHFEPSDETRTELEQALHSSPQDRVLMLLMADLALSRGDTARAQTALAGLPRTAASDALELFLHSHELMRVENWSAAVTPLEQTRQTVSNWAALLERTDLALAFCHERLGSIEQEIAALRRILKYRPECLPVRYRLAQRLEVSGHVAEAMGEYRALKADRRARVRLARLLMDHNLSLPDLARDWTEAEDLLSDAHRLEPASADEELARAELCVARRRPQILLQTLRENPVLSSPESLNVLAERCEQAELPAFAALWRGQSLLARRQFSDADAILKQAAGSLLARPTVETGATDELQRMAAVEAVWTLMHLALRSGRTEDALALFRQVAGSLKSVELARTYSLFGDQARCDALLAKELQSQPESLELLEVQADLLLEQGRTEQAAPLLRRLAELTTANEAERSSRARRTLALLLSQRSDYASLAAALRWINRSSSITSPSRTSTSAASSVDGPTLMSSVDRRVAARVLSSSGSPLHRRQAVSLFEELEDADALTASDRWLLSTLLEPDRPLAAVSQMQRAVASQLLSPPQLSKAIELFIRNQNPESARAALEQLRTVSTDRFPVQRYEWLIRVADGESRSVVEELQVISHSTGGSPAGSLPVGSNVDATQAAHDHAAKLAELAGLADWLSRYEPSNADGGDRLMIPFAEAMYRRAVELDATQVIALAEWLLRSGREAEAAALLPKLWQQPDRVAAAGLSLRILRLHPGEPGMQSVSVALESAVRQSPESPLFKLSLADLRVLQSRFDEAVKLYEEILTVDPDQVAALNQLAALLALRGHRLEDAMALIERAIQRAGPVPQLLDTRGCVSLALGNVRAAVADFETACKHDPAVEMRMHLALARAIRGDRDSARSTLQTAVAHGLRPERLTALELPLHEQLQKLLAGG